MDERVGIGKRWQTRSHAFEYAMARMMKDEPDGAKPR